MTQQSGTAAKKIRRVLVALVAGAVVMGAASQASAGIREDMAECRKQGFSFGRCCDKSGGDIVEILDNEGYIVKTSCVFGGNSDRSPDEGGDVKPEAPGPVDPQPSDPGPVVPAPDVPVEPVVDRSAPDTLVDSGPAPKIKRPVATFIFSAEPRASFECSLDGADFAACASPLTLTGLSRGQHTLQVAAIDEAGNRDDSPALSSFKVAKNKKR